MIFAIQIIMAVLLSIACASFFEWLLHRFVMHRPVGKFDYAFKAHAVVHHGRFKANLTYHLHHEEDKHTIPMAWWNGPVLTILAAGLFMPIIKLVGISWLLAYGVPFAITAVYYGVYEYIHWCMHLPKRRMVERSGIFFRLNGHHLLHHRYMHKNFNVVLPLADFCLGTLLTRSPIAFAQARGESVPDVQPLVSSL